MSGLMVKISTDIDNDWINHIGDSGELLKQKINKYFNEVTPVIEQYAKDNHRYQNRTGNLETETKIETVGIDIEGYIGPGAEYGKYVHEGHGTWQPDRFIEEAIDNNMNIIDDALNRAIDDTFKELFDE